MFRISEFARLTGVSIKALRHYHRLGLLTPAHVDERSGYRHYSAQQAPHLYEILALRDLGFPLATIVGILGQSENNGTLRRLLDRRRVEVVKAVENELQRLRQLEATLRELNGRLRQRLPQPVMRSLPAVRILSRRKRVRDLETGAQTLFEAVEADAARFRIRASGPPLLMYYDRDRRERNADIEACVPVVPGARAACRSRIRTLPAIPKAACVVYTGSYDQWAPTWRGLVSWLQRRRLRPAGPLRERFFVFGARGCEDFHLPPAFLSERKEDHVTEMEIPVRRSPARST